MVSLSISTVFCISPTIRFKSSPFSNTFAISFVICRIPPPRAPIISGTTTISYPGLLSLSSNAIVVGTLLVFPIFWCRYNVVADTPYHKSRFSSSPYPRVSGPVSSLSSSFVDGIRNPTPAFLYCSLSPFLSPTIPCTISHLRRPVRILSPKQLPLSLKLYCALTSIRYLPKPCTLQRDGPDFPSVPDKLCIFHLRSILLLLSTLLSRSSVLTSS